MKTLRSFLAVLFLFAFGLQAQRVSFLPAGEKQVKDAIASQIDKIFVRIFLLNEGGEIVSGSRGVRTEFSSPPTGERCELELQRLLKEHSTNFDFEIGKKYVFGWGFFDEEFGTSWVWGCSSYNFSADSIESAIENEMFSLRDSRWFASYFPIRAPGDVRWVKDENISAEGLVLYRVVSRNWAPACPELANKFGDGYIYPPSVTLRYGGENFIYPFEQQRITLFYSEELTGPNAQYEVFDLRLGGVKVFSTFDPPSVEPKVFITNFKRGSGSFIRVSLPWATPGQEFGIQNSSTPDFSGEVEEWSAVADVNGLAEIQILPTQMGFFRVKTPASPSAKRSGR